MVAVIISICNCRLGGGALVYRVLLASAVFVLAVPSLSTAEYAYFEIIPPGWTESEAADMNGSGIIVGSGRDSNNDFRGFVYRSGTYKTLLPPGWKESFAHGVNEKGDVVGHGLHGDFKGFKYSSGDYSDVIPPGWWEAYAYDINDRGVVVGYGRDTKYYKGFLYSSGEYIELLPDGWLETYALGINSNNYATGYGRKGKGGYIGFLYREGNYTEIIPPGWKDAKALAVNDFGAVAGYGHDSNDNLKGFMYSDGGYTEITAAGLQFIRAYGINNNGEIVGNVLYRGGDIKGFYFSVRSYFTMKPPGWKWAQNYMVNNDGDIIGVGSKDIFNIGFLAVGAPEVSIEPMAVFFGGYLKEGYGGKTVEVRNIGEKKLVIGAVSPPEPPFRINSDKCSGNVLDKLESCSIVYGLSGGSIKKNIVSASTIPSNDSDEKEVTITLGAFPDSDGDGYAMDVDCNDDNPMINPGAVEIYGNSTDDDCDPGTEDTSVTAE